MSNVIMICSFKLAKSASVTDFLLAAEKVNGELMSKQKGFISWKQLVDGDEWVDLLTWETTEDAMNAAKASEQNPIAHEFFAFLDMETVTMRIYTIKKSY